MTDFKYKNFETHERQRAYIVFYFYAKDTADYFESSLIEHDIPYERGSGKDLVKRHLIGVHRNHQEKAEELNEEANDFFRKPFLGSKQMRNGVLIFTLVIIALALIGYFIR